MLDRLFGDAEEINGHHRCPTYLYRWHLLRVGPVKVYLHRFVGEDWSLDLHDHPKRFISIGLAGYYYEQTALEPVRLRLYQAPWLRSFRPSHAHRIFVTPGRECWTLVLVGPTQREWGFWHLDRKFIPWREYVLGHLGDARKACAA